MHIHEHNSERGHGHGHVVVRACVEIWVEINEREPYHFSL